MPGRVPQLREAPLLSVPESAWLNSPSSRAQAALPMTLTSCSCPALRVHSAPVSFRLVLGLRVAPSWSPATPTSPVLHLVPQGPAHLGPIYSKTNLPLPRCTPGLSKQENFNLLCSKIGTPRGDIARAWGEGRRKPPSQRGQKKEPLPGARCGEESRRGCTSTANAAPQAS